MKLLAIHPEALDELASQVELLEEEREGHGRLMYEEVRRRVTQASRFPRSGAPIGGFDARYDVRCYTLRRFPFRVVTALIGGRRFVIAVAHTQREPGYWRERLR